MITVPAATPVTKPAEPTVAIPVLPLLHVPPEVPSDKVMLEPAVTVDKPVIAPAEGSGFTVTVAMTWQPEP